MKVAKKVDIKSSHHRKKRTITMLGDGYGSYLVLSWSSFYYIYKKKNHLSIDIKSIQANKDKFKT